jgi:hypothetical protein
MRKLFHRDGLQRREAYVRVEPDVMEWVVSRGFDRDLGARAIKRSIEMQIAQPLADQLAAFHHDSPLWVNLQMADSLSPTAGSKLAKSSPFHCRVEKLRHAKAAPGVQEVELETLIQLGDERLQHFSQMLQQWNPDDGTTAKENQRVMYYSLHDQIYRFRDLIRSAKEWIRDRKSPSIRPMQTNPETVVRRATNQRWQSTRRFLKEYQADQEIEDVVAESPGGLEGRVRSEAELRSAIRRSIDLCQSMIDHWTAPMRWVMEMRFLTEETDDLAEYVMADISDSRPSKLQDQAFMGGWSASVDPAVSFLECLANTLRVAFQYEVTRSSDRPYAALVAGIALPGILQPVLGTYQSMNFFGESLGCLLAYPVPADYSLETPAPESPTTQFVAPWFDSNSTIDWRTIRGSLHAGIHDFESDRRLEFDSSIELWSHWWLDLLSRSHQTQTRKV